MLTLLAGLVSVEMACRFLGLHTPVLYERTSFGFRPVPNQDIRRFGNHIYYDPIGLRSTPVGTSPAAGSLRLLFLGDSVINGGAMTDQADTLPFRLQRMMSERGVTTEVLNASSPGWAIGNEAGWLNRYGTLGAKYLVLTLNSFDLFQMPAPASTVGHHPSFPDKAPWLGVQELLTRYIVPQMLGRVQPADPGVDIGSVSIDNTRAILGDLRWILLRARHQQTEPVVVFVEPVGAMSMNDSTARAAKGMILELLKQLAVTTIETAQVIESAGGSALFRDGLHPNSQGNEIIASILARHLLTYPPH